MTKKWMASLGFSGLVLLASVSQAQGFMEGPLVQKTSNTCAGVAKAASDQVVSQQPLMFYALSESSLKPGSTVEVGVAVDGQLLAEESFVYEKPVNLPGVKTSGSRHSDQILFELFDTEPQIRAKVLAFSKSEDHRVEVTISADGAVVSRTSLQEFLAQSDIVRQLGILPTVTKSPAELFEVAAEWTIQQRLWVCGDNSCDQGGPNSEDCETCPEDCGGPCTICGNGNCGSGESCSTCSADCGACCPNTLPNETRNEVVGVTNYGWSCMYDIYFWGQSSYYNQVQYTVKATTYSRVRECNGSITETVVSVSYFYVYCDQYLGIPCSFPWSWPSWVC